MQRTIFSYAFKLFIASVISVCCTDAVGQFRQFPLESANPNARQGARTKVQPDTLDLPFWDDFSITTGNHPDTSKWLYGDRVFIGNTMGLNHPSINVATFDGLDSIGRAYDPLQVLETGFNDILTSQPIDLSESKVPASERSSVFLSFFYQWKGNGEAPDNSDFLQLQYLSSDSTWVEILKIETKSTYIDSIFYDTTLMIPDEGFFHNVFQFRFRNFGRKSGPFDTWNLDYVYLNKGRSAADVTFRDRSIGSPLSSPFGEYVAIPYKHFKLNSIVDTMVFDVSNLYDSATTAVYNIEGQFTSYRATDTVTTTKVLHDQTIRIEGQSRTKVTYDSLFMHEEDPALFDPAAKALDMRLKVTLLAGDKMHPSGQFDFRQNDTAVSLWRLHDYYAYDDGTAEYSAGLIEPGNRIAYQFRIENFAQLGADTLKALDFYFPAYGISSNQGITFYVYHDDAGKPGELWGSYGPRTLQQKPTGEFDRLPMIPALLINEPIFYIGWSQPSAGKALIGLDIDNNTGHRIFINETGAEWYRNEMVAGSLMIRPVFGNAPLQDEVNSGVEDDIQVSIYPNPNRGSFYLEGAFDNVRIFNTMGDEIFFDRETTDNKTLIQLNHPSGLFLVQVFKGVDSKTHRVIISR